MFSLNGKTALITGSGRGIGLAIAEAMAHQGANIFLSDINSSVVERAAGELAEQYPNVAVRGLTLRRDRQGADRKRHADHQGCRERPANPRQQCGYQPAGTRGGHGRRPVAEDARHEPDQRVPGIAGGVPHAQGKGRQGDQPVLADVRNRASHGIALREHQGCRCVSSRGRWQRNGRNTTFRSTVLRRALSPRT